MSLLEELLKKRREELMKDFEITEIRLKPANALILAEELSKETGETVHFVHSFLGISVVVDSFIPDDVAFIVRKKEPSEQ